MSEAKPLSAERRAEILEHMQLDQWGNAVNLPMIEDILAAEEYWRNAVKNAGCEIGFSEYFDYTVCHYCNVQLPVSDTPETHKPECPWVLANRD